MTEHTDRYAEKTLLGALLGASRQEAGYVLARIEEHYFSVPAYRVIFSAIREAPHGGPGDRRMIVLDYLLENGLLAGGTGRPVHEAYLHLPAAETLMLPHLTAILTRAAERRTLTEIGLALVDASNAQEPTEYLRRILLDGGSQWREIHRRVDALPEAEERAA